MMLYCKPYLAGKCAGIKEKQSRVVTLAIVSRGWENVSLRIAGVYDEPCVRIWNGDGEQAWIWMRLEQRWGANCLGMSFQKKDMEFTMNGSERGEITLTGWSIY